MCESHKIDTMNTMNAFFGLQSTGVTILSMFKSLLIPLPMPDSPLNSYTFSYVLISAQYKKKISIRKETRKPCIASKYSQESEGTTTEEREKKKKDNQEQPKRKLVETKQVIGAK